MPDLRRTLLIFRRELTDSLRDRRTVFMMLVLPVVLYPALVIGGLQLTGINRAAEKKKTYGVMIAGIPGERLKRVVVERRAKDQERFDKSKQETEARGDTFIQLEPDHPLDQLKIVEVTTDEAEKAARELQDDREIEYRPADGGDPVPIHAVGIASEEFANWIAGRGPPPPPESRLEVRVIYNGRTTGSLAAADRLHELLRQLQEDEFEANVNALEQSGPLKAWSRPIRFNDENVQPNTGLMARQFVGTLSLLLVIMALTGAFYPAVDLVAGEKERGTIETLLISPATRLETVLGKFAVVWSFSVTTALLNLASLGLTFWYVMGLAGKGRQMPEGFKPENFQITLTALIYIFGMLLPLAALFSGLALALSTFARSAREGQYYLSPLFLIALPLALPASIPETSLSAFRAQIPITGITLALKDMLIAGSPDKFEWKLIIPALLTTGLYAGLAIAWAVRLFGQEAVLFREAEEFRLGLWLRRQFTLARRLPRPGDAGFLFAFCLSGTWFVGALLALYVNNPALQGLLQQLSVLLVPTLIYAAVLRRTAGLDFRATFSLRASNAAWLPLVPVMAVASLMLVGAFANLVRDNGWLPNQGESEMAKMFARTPLWAAVLVFALTPAICEELLCRGFLMAGLRREGQTDLRGVVTSAMMFGLLHILGTPLQVVYAVLMGLVIGFIVLRTGSILFGMLFHFTFNGVSVSGAALVETAPWLQSVLDAGNPAVVGASAVVLAVSLGLIHRFCRSPDEAERDVAFPNRSAGSDVSTDGGADTADAGASESTATSKIGRESR